jgi:non-ribosomal peptide synthetase component F
VEHRNVVRLFSATDAWFGFSADDVWTLFHSFAFDFSVWELWGALLHGGRVVVVPYLVCRDPAAFHALLRLEGVTMLSQTPSAFRQLIHVDAERGGSLALRAVVFGGEALEPASLREWVERRGTETPRLVNMYGITETTVHVTYRPLERDDVFGGAGSPIGVRIPDLRLYVLDPALRPVPRRHPGRAVRGRRRRGARLPEPSAADSGALHPRPLRRIARRAAVPHGGPGAVEGKCGSA